MATGLTNITGVTSRTSKLINHHGFYSHMMLKRRTPLYRVLPWSYDSLVVSCVTTVLTSFGLSSHGEDLGLPFLCAVPWGSFGFNGKVQSRKLRRIFNFSLCVVMH